MKPELARDAAAVLIDARRAIRQVADFPAQCRPADIDDGYAVQAAFIEGWDAPVAGWKVACTADDQQAMVGVAHPFCGPLFAPVVFDSPARIEAARFHCTGLESEFAFRMAEALPDRGSPYGRDEVADAVEALIPALEIVSPRYENWLALGAPAILADCAGNGGAVLGAPVRDWRSHDLAAITVTLSFDGRPVAQGKGERVLGHPLESLSWTVNELARRTGGVRAGDVILTGTCTGLNWIEPGVAAKADFGAFGSVEATFE